MQISSFRVHRFTSKTLQYKTNALSQSEIDHPQELWEIGTALKNLFWNLLSLSLHLALGLALWFSAVNSLHSSPDEVIDLTLSSPLPQSGEKLSRPSLPKSVPQKLTAKSPLPSETSTSTAEATPQENSGATETSGNNGDSTPVGWGDVTRFPKVIKEYKANYPEEAKQARVDGPVILDILIDRTGKVRDVRVVSGPGYGLNESAIEALKKFEFQPAQKGTESVAVKIRYTYRFKLGVN
ncbi:MAG: energy transducer TonB [Bdellovibrio sp.]|nr:energy transducer TonB [Bdellovibrio sp.]